MNNVIEYAATIKHEGFTPTRLHYFVLILSEKPHSINTNKGMLEIRPHKSFTHVIFANNPLHKYITECKGNNTPISIKGAILEQSTGFTYTPHAKINGQLQPLMVTKLDTDGKYKQIPAQSSIIRIFINDNDTNKTEEIINKEIDKLKKYKV